MHVKFFRNKHEGVDNPLNTDNALKALEEEVNAYARQCRAQSMTLSPIESIGKWITIAVTFPCDPPSTDAPTTDAVNNDLDLEKGVAKLKRRLVTQALASTHNDVAAAAKLLGIKERDMRIRFAALVEEALAQTRS